MFPAVPGNSGRNSETYPDNSEKDDNDVQKNKTVHIIFSNTRGQRKSALYTVQVYRPA